MTTKNDTANEEPLAEAVEAAMEKAQFITLDVDDMRTGLAFAQETARAQARLQMAFDSEATFVQRMREKYKIDPNQYELRDWITGFEAKKE